MPSSVAIIASSMHALFGEWRGAVVNKVPSVTHGNWRRPTISFSSCGDQGAAKNMDQR